jgi:hypothetical protein
LIRGALSGIYVQTIKEGMKVSCVSDGSLFFKRKGSHTAGLYVGVELRRGLESCGEMAAVSRFGFKEGSGLWVALRS